MNSTPVENIGMVVRTTPASAVFAVSASQSQHFSMKAIKEMSAFLKYPGSLGAELGGLGGGEPVCSEELANQLLKYNWNEFQKLLLLLNSSSSELSLLEEGKTCKGGLEEARGARNLKGSRALSASSRGCLPFTVVKDLLYSYGASLTNRSEKDLRLEKLPNVRFGASVGEGVSSIESAGNW